MGRFSEWREQSHRRASGEPAAAAGDGPGLEALGGPAPEAERREDDALPCGLRVGMRVRTTEDCFWPGEGGLCVARGTPGDVAGPGGQDYVLVECDRAFRGGCKVHGPVRLPARFLERHPLEKMQLDPRTAPAPDGASGGCEEAAWEDEAPRSRQEMPQQPKAKPEELGTGALYEVVAARAVQRAAPSLAAAAVGCKLKGSVVELFDWDASRRWRRCVDGTSWVSGWMLLDSAEFGPLLRPLGLPFQVKPHEPLCIAAHENNLADLKAFLGERVDPNVKDAGERTPLGLAAAAGHLAACVQLLDAGADAGEALAQQGPAEGEEGPSSTCMTRALLRAFAGILGDDLELMCLALAQLEPEEREVADELLRGFMDPRLRHLGWRRWHEAQAALKAADGAVEAGTGEAGAPPSGEAVGQPEAAAEDREESPMPLVERRTEADAAPGWRVPPERYQVVVKSCAIRETPALNARAIGARACGAVVELGEYDATGEWRKVSAQVLGSHRGDGWMLLNHSSLFKRCMFFHSCCAARAYFEPRRWV